MKTKPHIWKIALLLAFSFALLLTLPYVLVSCMQPNNEQEEIPLPQSAYTPQFISRAQLDSSIKVSSPRSVGKTGKIYIKDTYLMVIEPEVGVHVFQNADPENPSPLKFIEAPGIHDIAIRGDLWCIDNAVDLVFFTYSYGNSLQIIKRHPKFFPEPIPPDVSVMPAISRPGENFFIVNWIKTK